MSTKMDDGEPIALSQQKLEIVPENDGKTYDAAGTSPSSDLECPAMSQVASTVVVFPDGGILAWSQVFMGFLVMFSTWGLINAWGVFESYYKMAPALGTQSAISWIGSTQSFLLLFSGAVWGRAMDAGYTRSLLTFGSILIVLSLIAASFSGSAVQSNPISGKAHIVYWEIVCSQGILCGIGMGLTFLPSLGVPATYFAKRRALATGLVTSGASIGGILYPIIVERLLSEVGFRWTLRIVAFIVLATLSMACVLIRQRRDLPPKAKYPLVPLKALCDPHYSYLVFGMLCSFVGCYIPYYYIQTRAEEAGIDLQGLDSFYLVSFLSAGGIFGRIIPNYVADRVGPVLVHATCVLIGGGLIFAWPFALNLGSLVAFTVIYGFFSGAFISLPPSTIGSVTQDMAEFGARLGLAVTINGLGLLVGPPIAGAIISSQAGYIGGASFAGSIVCFGSLLLFLQLAVKSLY